MRLGTAQIPPSLDPALKSFPLRDAGHANFLSRFEEVHSQNLADGVLFALLGLQTELPQMLLRSNLGLVEVALERLRHFPGLALRVKADLNRLITISADS